MKESDEVCELCGRRMVIKYGPHGRFLACPDFLSAAIPSLISRRLAWHVPSAAKILL